MFLPMILFFYLSEKTLNPKLLHDPRMTTGRELLDLFAERKTTDWLDDLNLSRLSRQYLNGLNIGRNCFGRIKLSAKQVAEIQKRIAFIKSVDEYEEAEIGDV